MKAKLMSRKFWICVAAFMSSIAASISGMATDNEALIATGTICGMISAAIYAFCEAWCDAKAIEADDVFMKGK